MQKNAEETRKLFSRLLREERQAFERLKDILHKYRTALPYLYGRSKTLEDRLTLLMEHRDDTKTGLAGVRSKYRLVQMQAAQLEDNLKRVRQRKNFVVAQYNAMLAGKLPPTLETGGAGADMAEKRVQFMARLAEAFSEMEKEIAALDRETAALEEAGKKLAAKAAKLAKKAKIAETKLALYQNDIRDVMVELNNEEQNEQKIAAEFSELARLLKSAADVPPWGMKVFAEAVEKELPRGEILQLQKPIDNLLHLH